MNIDSKKTILVVDDGNDSRFLLTSILKASGYNVQCTANGKEALSLLQQSKILPDLILLDAHMPIMDGNEFRCIQMRDAVLKDIPVVVMTGDNDLVNMSQNMMNPVKVILKPLHIESFIKTVSNSLIH